jgi:predicted CXXCH cytochrome family protein
MKSRIVVSMTMLAVIAAALAWVPATSQAQATTKTHQQQTLDYVTQTENFTIGETVTGATSGATAIIRVDNDSGSNGSLTLTGLFPGPGGDFFLDGETIAGQSTGIAIAAGVLSFNRQCSFCHTLHGAPGGKLNTADTFDNTCLTCHGSATPDPDAPSPMMFHTNETCTRNCSERPFFLGCNTCHVPHGNLENRMYDAGLEHPHNQPNDCESGGGLVKCDGFNRKLVGTTYDGTRIAKMSTPITVLTASWAGGVATITLQVNNAPDAPPHTIMAGDRITVRRVWSANNATGVFEQGFNGNFIVESATSWNGALEATITYKLAANPGAYLQNDLTRGVDPNTGMVQSTGWYDRAKVTGAGWASGTATLGLRVGHSIEAGDVVSVTGVESGNNPVGTFGSGFNGIFTVTGVIGNDITYTLAADPGAFQASSGRVEYPGSIKVIQLATQDTGAQTLTLRTYRTHAIQVNDIVTVFKDDPNPATFNAVDSVKRFEVTAITAFDADRDDIELSCLPGSPTVSPPPPPPASTPGYEVCDLAASLAVDFTGGVLQSSGTLRPVVLESRGTDWNEDTSHSFADVDLDQDNVMDGPCELCHTRAGINHANYNFNDAHNDGRGCTETCHPHTRPAGAFFR